MQQEWKVRDVRYLVITDMILIYNVASYRSRVGSFKSKIELSEGRFPPLFPQMSLETFKNIAVSILIWWQPTSL